MSTFSIRHPHVVPVLKGVSIVVVAALVVLLIRPIREAAFELIWTFANEPLGSNSIADFIAMPVLWVAIILWASIAFLFAHIIISLTERVLNFIVGSKDNPLKKGSKFRHGFWQYLLVFYFLVTATPLFSMMWKIHLWL